MEEIVAFSVTLHDIGQFWIVDVVDLEAHHDKRGWHSRICNGHTGSRVSGVTPQRSSHVTYALPKEPSGYCANLFMSIVVELTRGLSFNTRRPSGLVSIWSLRRGRLGPAVVSPRAATISTVLVSLGSPWVQRVTVLTSSTRIFQ